MGLAEIAGLEVARHGLIRMADGGLAYITRRFDRDRGRKRAVEDLCQLSGKPTAAKYRSSAEKTGKIIRQPKPRLPVRDRVLRKDSRRDTRQQCRRDA